MTECAGLLGYPVAHSVSPAMHNAAFSALELDWRYDLLSVPPGQLADAITRLLDAGYRGFNVTIPHKQAALTLPQITTVTVAARAIGAVNTLAAHPDGTLTADNTDWRGFARVSQQIGIALEQTPCLVLGTGGSARAVIYALRQGNALSITQVSRDPAGRPGTIGYDDLAHLEHDGYYIINCTPVGMHPHVDESPWPGAIPFPPLSVIHDLVYNPSPTRLVREARAKGLRAYNGLDMLVQQGALAFALWTGREPPLDVMANAARAALHHA